MSVSWMLNYVKMIAIGKCYEGGSDRKTGTKVVLEVSKTCSSLICKIKWDSIYLLSNNVTMLKTDNVTFIVVFLQKFVKNMD